MLQIFQQARQAARELNLFSPQLIDEVLMRVAQRLRDKTDYLLHENEKDLQLQDITNPR